MHPKGSVARVHRLSRPKIGITGTSPAHLKNYVEAVEAAGGEAVPLFSDSGRSAEDILGSLDALVLSGGDDIDPAVYGEATLDGMNVKIDSARDALELPLTRLAIQRDLPVLGICRGIQTLNVAMGGTLYQDIVLAGLPKYSHHQRTFTPPPPDDAAVHPVTIDPGSRLREILGAAFIGERIAASFPVRSRRHISSVVLSCATCSPDTVRSPAAGSP